MSSGDPHEGFSGGPDDPGPGGPPDPLDRLWLHPSEMGRRTAPATPPAPTPAGNSLWLTALGAGMLGAVTTLAVLALLGLLGAPDQPNKPVAGATSDSALTRVASDRSGDHVLEVRAKRADDSFSIGSGISMGGTTVLTSAQLLQDSVAITVTRTDGRSHSAKVIGTDAFTDVALVDTEEPLADAANFETRVRVGDSVVAVAASGDGQPWVSTGVVSGLNAMETVGSTAVPGLIQTNATVNSRCAGGALVDGAGNVIGLMVATNTNRGNAVPIDVARNVAENLRKTGTVPRAWLGLTVRDADGVEVVGVEPNSPAANAGIQPGTTVRKIDGRPIGVAAALYAEIARRTVGDKILLTVRSGATTQDIGLTLVDRNAAAATTTVAPSGG